MLQIKFTLFATLIIFLNATAIEENQYKIQPRTSQYENVVRGDFPFYAVIKIPNLPFESTLCGGTLIGNQWMLTTAFCLKDVTAETSIEILFNSVNPMDETEVGREVIHLMPSTPKTDFVFIHPGYKRIIIMK